MTLQENISTYISGIVVSLLLLLVPSTAGAKDNDTEAKTTVYRSLTVLPYR